ncbi:MAG: hypothetical protein ACQKBT_12830, partial [Puniceicoccales bacterium]
MQKFLYTLALINLSICLNGWADTMIYRDLFPEGDAHPVGGSLEGEPLQQGGRLWSEAGSVIVVEDNAITSVGTGSAWFPLYQEVDSVEVEAVLRTTGVEWVALALGGDLGKSFFQEVQLWVYVRDTGLYEVVANGTSSILAKGKVPHFNTNGNEVELVYAGNSNEVSLILNGEIVLENASLGDFRPEIETVGVRFHRARPGASLGPSIVKFEAVVTGELSPVLAIELNELGVYEPEEGITTWVEANGLGSFVQSIHLELVDFYQERVWNRTIDIEEDSGSLRRRIEIPAEHLRGYFQLRGSILSAEGKTIVDSIEPLAVLPQPTEEARTDENPFGAMVKAHGGYPFEEKLLDARYMERIGLRYVRTHRFNLIHARGRLED